MLKPAKQQQGVVLVTGLIFLVILTMLGTSSLQGTLLEEKMAGNLRDETLALQAAEAALRSGETFLEGVTIPVFAGSGGLYHYTTAVAPDPKTWSDWESLGQVASISMAGVASQPRYIIEQLASIPQQGNQGSAQQSGTAADDEMFRVLARGVGGTASAVVILQSFYRR